ncbi:MAG: 1-phosphofructokinase [Candidatus Izemoplasma sp.]|nr:1-phosphofructokinase [Candidatus Izemoplasma sp.]
MIYTCTLNPAIDYRIECDTFNLGTLNRSSFSKFTVGGKGINVSMVLKELDTKSVAIGYTGGFTGTYIKEYLIDELNIENHFIDIPSPTRINVKLLVDDEETEINQSGPIIGTEELKLLTDFIDTLNTDDILVCGGSQGRSKQNSYLEIAKQCHHKNIDFIIDSSGQSMLDVLAYHPLLVKPNIYELEEYFDVTLNTEDKIISYGKKLIDLGAKNVIVSRGEKGSLFINDNHIYRADLIIGDVKNTVGAGDSMVAGFVSAYTQRQNDKQAYQLAVASATATAFSYSLAKREDIDKYLNQVVVNEVKR